MGLDSGAPAVAAVQSTLSMWGEKMRPPWPTSSFAGGAGAAHFSI